jgi:hypothetical protein
VGASDQTRLLNSVLGGLRLQLATGRQTVRQKLDDLDIKARLGPTTTCHGANVKDASLRSSKASKTQYQLKASRSQPSFHCDTSLCSSVTRMSTACGGKIAILSENSCAARWRRLCDSAMVNRALLHNRS